MKRRIALTVVLLLVLLCNCFIANSTSMPTASAESQSSRPLINGGTTAISPTVQGADGLASPELDTGEEDEGAASPPSPTHRGKSKGKSPKNQSLTAPVVNSSAVSGATPGQSVSFNGLNLRDQRLANGGNQFTVEPPDQALCVGNGYVLESVNDVLRVYSTAGAALLGVTDLNTFYRYPPAIIRSTLTYGPAITDPICHFDPETQRFYHVVLTLDRIGTTSAYSGKNHLDIAVSTTSSPLGTWQIYKIPVQNDGTDGTPNDGCTGDDGVTPGEPCIGDYPHIGADKYGIYLTTNEYSFFGPEYKYARVYAISKRALANGVANPTVIQFGNTVVEKAGTPGFTVWPAISPTAADFALSDGGTEFFMSSMAAEEANNTTGFDNRIGVWALTNTSSLDTANPKLTLSSRSIDSEVYGLPPLSNQKAGSNPLKDCLNDRSNLFGPGLGCWALLVASQPTSLETQPLLDSNDTRMQQVSYAKGLLWGALDTVVNVSGANKAGIAYFIVKPVVIGNGQHVGPQTAIVKQGYVALTNNNVTRPSIAILSNGKGVIGYNVVGNDYYPSQAYSFMDVNGVGAINIAAAGVGPQDGFAGYKAFSGPNPRYRWGDYGAAAVDGNSIWIANEFIAQTCTLQQYLTAPIGSCGGTRVSLGNWATRISKVTP